MISVSDKTGLEEFAKGLHEFGVELISTGGTAAFLKGLGLPVIEISDYTGEPELFEGRLKTLHPMVHGGLLHRRDNEEHVRQAKENGIKPIDLVCVNLYPFEETVARPGVSLSALVKVFLLCALYEDVRQKHLNYVLALNISTHFKTKIFLVST